jgi:hypothetical protein
MTAIPPVREVQKRYGSTAMALAIGVSLIFLILGHKAQCRGIVMGALFSTLNFVLMGETIHRAVKPDRSKASLSAFGNILFRYSLLAIPLFLAIKYPRFDLATTIAGLLMVQFVILVDHISQRFIYSWRR